MNFRLTLTIYYIEISEIEVIENVKKIFSVDPEITLLPISSKIIEEIEKQYGKSVTLN